MFTRDQLNLMGFIVSGDVDGITIYTDKRGRKVAYPAVTPSVPWSPLQLAWKARFALGMKFWRTLTPSQKLDYRRVCDLSSLCMGPANLYLHFYIRQNRTLWQTLCQQYSIPLVFPPCL